MENYQIKIGHICLLRFIKGKTHYKPMAGESVRNLRMFRKLDGNEFVKGRELSK